MFFNFAFVIVLNDFFKMRLVFHAQHIQLPIHQNFEIKICLRFYISVSVRYLNIICVKHIVTHLPVTPDSPCLPLIPLSQVNLFYL